MSQPAMPKSATSKSTMPKAVLFFGFANTLLGACGIVTGVSALIQPQMTVASKIYQQVDLSAQSTQWLHLAMVMSPISSAIMLICGIGLLRKKAWGRTLAIYYGLASIAFSVIASGINISRIADKSSNLTVLNVILGIAISVLFGLMYKVAMIHFLRRDSVKAALNPQPVEAKILEFKSVKKSQQRSR
jgi:uncharacterized membrane protein (DUF2068 family)